MKTIYILLVACVASLYPFSVLAQTIELHAICDNQCIKLLYAGNLSSNGLIFERANEDGIFEEIEVLKVEDQNTSAHSMAMDPHPMRGVNYYRVREFVDSEKIHSSKIIAVDYRVAENNFLTPNPAHDFIRLHQYQPSKLKDCDALNLNYDISIYDLSGNLVLQQKWLTQIGDNYLQLDIGNIGKGVYTIHVKNSIWGRVDRFVKN